MDKVDIAADSMDNSDIHWGRAYSGFYLAVANKVEVLVVDNADRLHVGDIPIDNAHSDATPASTVSSEAELLLDHSLIALIAALLLTNYVQILPFDCLAVDLLLELVAGLGLELGHSLLLLNKYTFTLYWLNGLNYCYWHWVISRLAAVYDYWSHDALSLQIARSRLGFNGV